MAFQVIPIFSCQSNSQGPSGTTDGYSQVERAVLDVVFCNPRPPTETISEGKQHRKRRRWYPKFQSRNADGNLLYPTAIDKDLKVRHCQQQEDSKEFLCVKFARFNLLNTSSVVVLKPTRFSGRPLQKIQSFSNLQENKSRHHATLDTVNNEVRPIAYRNNKNC